MARPESKSSAPRRRAKLAYWALLMFSFIYFARPEDFIPGLDYLPVGKISAGIALVALLFSWRRRQAKMPLEIKLVLGLFFYLCLTIPFAFWRGGSYAVVINQFSKAAIAAVLISMIVSEMWELKRLLWVHAAAMAILAVASIVARSGASLRMKALSNGIANPNDLAISLVIAFPLCIAFLLAARSAFKKVLWTAGIVFMLYGLVATYSRSGFVAMAICFVICVWEFGIKGKRIQVLAAAFVFMIASVGFAITAPNYMLRLQSLFAGGDVRGSFDKGSLDARRELLDQSISITLHHPIFGVGPGNFEVVTETWHVTHNTYTELSSEGGIPSLLIFLTILGLTFRNLRGLGKAPRYKTDPELRLFNSALWAGMWAYVVGAAFSSTAYLLYPYFMVAYVSALYRIGFAESPSETKQPVATIENPRKPKNNYGKKEQPSLAWTR
jgi:O-antigen ligase